MNGWLLRGATGGPHPLLQIRTLGQRISPLPSSPPQDSTGTQFCVFPSGSGSACSARTQQITTFLFLALPPSLPPCFPSPPNTLPPTPRPDALVPLPKHSRGGLHLSSAKAGGLTCTAFICGLTCTKAVSPTSPAPRTVSSLQQTLCPTQGKPSRSQPQACSRAWSMPV